MQKNLSGNGRNPTRKEILEAERVSRLDLVQQKSHPSSVKSNPEKLSHINTYGSLPEYYIDKPFVCRKCGKAEIWKAESQKWYYEVAKGHISAEAVECHNCRARQTF